MLIPLKSDRKVWHLIIGHLLLVSCTCTCYGMIKEDIFLLDNFSFFSSYRIGNAPFVLFCMKNHILNCSFKTLCWPDNALSFMSYKKPDVSDQPAHLFLFAYKRDCKPWEKEVKVSHSFLQSTTIRRCWRMLATVPYHKHSWLLWVKTTRHFTLTRSSLLHLVSLFSPVIWMYP